MDFRDYTAHETLALIEGVLGRRGEELLRELRSVRQAVDAALHGAEAALSASDSRDGEELAGLVERLTSAAGADARAAEQRVAAEAQAATDAVRRELDDLKEHQKTLAAECSDAQADVASIRGELKEQIEENGRLTAALEAARSDLELRRSEGEAAARDSEALRAELLEANGRIEAALAEAARATEAHAQADAAQQEAETVLEQEAQARAAAEAELAKLRQWLQENERTLQSQETAGKEEDVRLDVGSEAGTRDGRSLDRLLQAFARIAAAGTIAEVSAAIVHALSADFSRVALFSVKGNRLEGTDHVGLDFKSDISKIVIPLTIDTPLCQAVSSGRVESRTARELTDSSRSLFGGSPASVLALPIVVEREAVAVVYADDSEQPASDEAELDRKIKFAELLRQHSAPLLLSLSAELKSLKELRDYATLLLNEVEYLYLADAAAGMGGADLRKRLQDNLECARGIYAQRIKAEGPYAAPLLDERLSTVLGSRSSTQFGRDLAAAAGGKAHSQRTDSHPAAEAS
jgi:hypothetical protein